MVPQIRAARPEDLDALVLLCAAHAEYERCDYSSEGKADRLREDLFAENPALYCLVVEADKQLVGYATYMVQYATWDAAAYLYMDCLFMNESSRGYGIGESLMKQLMAEAKRLQCSHIQWQTPDFNTRAIKFYKRIGAHSKSKERFFLSP